MRDRRDARLWEIAENLHRAELTEAERRVHIAEWVRLTAEKVRAEQADDVSHSGTHRGTSREHAVQPAEEGIRKASKELGLPKSTVSRAVAALPLAALPAEAEAAPAGDDAALLRLGAEFQRRHLRYAELDAAGADMVDIPEEITAEIGRIVPVLHRLSEEIAGLRATTVAGLRVKAAVLLTYMPFTWEGDPVWDGHDDLLAWSIGRDLCGDAATRPPSPTERAPMADVTGPFRWPA